MGDRHPPTSPALYIPAASILKNRYKGKLRLNVGLFDCSVRETNVAQSTADNTRRITRLRMDRSRSCLVFPVCARSKVPLS